MSKRSANAANKIVNPYLKDKKSKTASAPASSAGNDGIVNPYQKQQHSKRPQLVSTASAGARASDPIDLTSSPESSPSKKKKARNVDNAHYKIFCDLDGVLVDFDAGVERALGSKPDALPSNYLWAGVSRTPSFYENLPWMRDGQHLWNAIKHLDPDILTGVPMAKKARAEKALWCRRELGKLGHTTNHVDMAGKKKTHEVVSGRRKKGIVNVITCWSRNKHCESGHRAVLIDDRISLQDDWVSKGGIFVHHTETRRTLTELRRLGILSPEKK